MSLDGTDGNSDGMYFLEKRCSKETKITDTEECKKACESMGFPLSNRPFKDKKPCYKGGTGVCNQNGALGKQSEMICKNNGDPIKLTYCITKTFSIIDNIICLFLQLQSKLPHARTQVAKQHQEITMVCLNIIFLKITINT